LGSLTLFSDIRITGRYEVTLFDLTGCYILPSIKSVCAKRERWGMKGRVAERENFLLIAWMFSHHDDCTGNVCFTVYRVTEVLQSYRM